MSFIEFDDGSTLPIDDQGIIRDKTQAEVDKENAEIARGQLQQLRFNRYFKGIHDATTPVPEFENEDAKFLAERFFDDVSNLVNAYATEASRL